MIRRVVAVAVAAVSAAAAPALGGIVAPPGDPIQPPPVTAPVLVPRPVAGLTPWPGNMAYYGGRVMVRPHAYLVFWGWHDDRDRFAERLTRFFEGIGGSAYVGVATQYYQDQHGRRVHITNPRRQLAGVWWDRARPPYNSYPESLVADEAVRAARHFHATSDPDAVVFVVSPRDRNPSGFVDGGYCAWHSWTDGIEYANLPYLLAAAGGCGGNYVNAGPAGRLDGVSMVAGHEYMEAITDPGVGYNEPGQGWRGVDWEENADKCEWIEPNTPGGAADIRLRTGTFAVQATWSNAALGGLGDCVVS